MAGTLRISTLGMIGAGEMVVLAVAEIGEADSASSSLTSVSDSRSLVSRRRPSFSSRFHLPFSPQRKPTEPCGTTISPVVSSIGDGLPFGIVGLAQVVGEVRGAQEALRHVASPCFTSRTSIGMSVYWRA